LKAISCRGVRHGLYSEIKQWRTKILKEKTTGSQQKKAFKSLRNGGPGKEYEGSWRKSSGPRVPEQPPLAGRRVNVYLRGNSAVLTAWASVRPDYVTV
jgi:hypothetical protein